MGRDKLQQIITANAAEAKQRAEDAKRNSCSTLLAKMVQNEEAEYWQFITRAACVPGF